MFATDQLNGLEAPWLPSTLLVISPHYATVMLEFRKGRKFGARLLKEKKSRGFAKILRCTWRDIC